MCCVAGGEECGIRCALPQHEAWTACRQGAGRVCAREVRREGGREECCLGGRLLVGELGEGRGGLVVGGGVNICVKNMSEFSDLLINTTGDKHVLMGSFDKLR